MRNAKGLCAILGLVLAGCGGGGDASPPPATASPGSGGSNPVLPPSSVAFSATSISATASNPGSVSTQRLMLQFTNRSGSFFYRWRQTGGLLRNVGAVLLYGDNTAAQLGFDLVPPERLGAGTYTGSVAVSICEDSECTRPISGSPVDVAINYVVTGNTKPGTRVSWSFGGTTTDFETKQTQSPAMTLRISIYDAPLLRSLYIRPTRSTTGLVTAMTAPSPPTTSSSGQYEVTYDVGLKAPARLGSGLFSDEVQMHVCLDADCAEEAEGSPFAIKPDIRVLATEGEQVTSRVRDFADGTRSVAWSPLTQRLYVALARNTATSPGPAFVHEVDPWTLETNRAAMMNSHNLGDIAAATDGSGLFVVTQNDTRVHHLQLPSLVNDYDINTTSQNLGAPYAVLPLAGQPQSVMLALQALPNKPALVVYDIATLRPAPVIALLNEQPIALARGATADIIYAQRIIDSFSKARYYDRLQVLPTGVMVANRANTNPYPNGDIYRPRLAYGGGKLIDGQGAVRDAATGELVAKLPMPPDYILQSHVIDEARNRVFVLAQQYNSGPYVLSFSLEPLKFLAIARVAPDRYDYLNNARMTLWGGNGIAFTNQDMLAVMSGSFFTTYDGSPDPSTTSGSPLQ